ncbi:MAG TPA: serine hydrolase domain-containing protein [Steroidobacteraceae bacterium]|nr:serine hydrolase domain-containing protein [Steroidobacteraceae bacterium]
MASEGFDTRRLAHVTEVIKADIERGLYHGAVLRVARGGKLALDVTIGSADAERSKPLRPDSVFSIFSVTKAFTNVLTLRAIELGYFALTTRICEIIPEFSGFGRERIQIWHLLSHQAGLPIIFEVKPGMYIDRFDEMVAAVIEVVKPVDPPCEKVAYSPLVHHVLLGEAVRRTDPRRRSYRAIVQEEILDPLGMKDTSVGVRADLKSRKIVPDFRGNYPIGHRGHSNLGPNGAFEEEHAEMPWVGIASTVPDMYRFAEMLREDGVLDGQRILSPAILELARRNWTGEKPNELNAQRGRDRGWDPEPAYLGLGFALRGTALCHHLFGTLASPGTFGNYGAGTTLFWVDPERDLTFVCLSAGVMESNANTERFQRLSDIVISAAT